MIGLFGIALSQSSRQLTMAIENGISMSPTSLRLQRIFGLVAVLRLRCLVAALRLRTDSHTACTVWLILCSTGAVFASAACLGFALQFHKASGGNILIKAVREAEF